MTVAALNPESSAATVFLEEVSMPPLNQMTGTSEAPKRLRKTAATRLPVTVYLS